MNDPQFSTSPDLQALLSELIDGKLSDQGQQKLREILRGSAEAQDEYRNFMALHALLHLDLGEGRLQLLPPVAISTHAAQAACAAPASFEPQDKAARWGTGEEDGRVLTSLWPPRLHALRESKWRLAGATAALAASLLFVWSFLSSGPPFGSPVGVPIAQTETNEQAKSLVQQDAPLSDVRAVAVIGQASKASWSDPQLPVSNGASLRPGGFKLEQGLVQIEFFSGASAIIEAPAQFELVSSNRIVCKLGKIRAHVPSQAKGFTVETPTYAAVDLGTEFTVQVGQTGESKFQVLDGEVHLWDGLPEQSVLAQRLTAGQGVRATPAGELIELGALESNFVGRKEMLEQATISLHERYEDWKQFSQKIRSAENVILYFGFDGHAPWERVLRNDGANDSELLYGAIVGCQWTTGRWNGKQALEFKRTSDRVRLNVPGEFESLTFAAWLRIEGLERWLSSLMLTDGHQPGEVHWQMTDRGQLMLGVKAEPDESHDFYSPSVIGPKDLGRWVHLACVYNGKEGYVSHVVDGVEVSREDVRIPTTLRIGPAEIGNWVPQDLKEYRIRSLNGRVDEFILFDRPLTTEEIHSIYEAGVPQS
ncbi:MAG: LamG-like jellyroll fold domain-containing protein [Pirellulales bacterium]